ncbi:hypothetical protein QQM39_21420 [Streptomyces sp. DT2A-34]|uniref:hypothetical protein n=1 Tax=Streptomyces sp. DT2A-34 TaxID=3051182 RepID=UPI00265C88D8|nr:hypothetical protein [Streptomyces sp. DT2A-34]MDO0913312.1 hypothetical protein [Streptomyces sp. DT2A-34]
MPDPRGRRRTRYEFGFLPAASAVAVVCGARSLLGLARWIRGAPGGTGAPRPGPARGVAGVGGQHARAGLTRHRFRRPGRRAVLWVAQVLSADPAVAGNTPAAVAFDGKIMRGAARAGTRQPHLVAVVDQASGTVVR